MKNVLKKHRIIVRLLLTLFCGFPVHAGEAIDLGAIYALTGAAAEANSYALQGVGYAVAEINQKGGIFGKKINLRVFDNQSTPIGSTLAAREAAAAGVAAIVGPDWSSHSIAAARVLQAAEIPMISSLSTNPRVTRIGNYIFRVCFTDAFQGRIIARFARQDLKAATAVVFVDVTSDYSMKLAEIFRIHFEQLGGRIQMELEYKLKQQHFTQAIQKAAAADADVIFIPGHDESGMIARQAQNAGAVSIFLGGDGWSTPVFYKKGGAALKRGYYSTHWSAYLDTDQSRAFVRAYGIQPESADDNTALGYDAMMLLADAIRRAGTTERKKIRNAIAATRGFNGVTGTISFNAHGDPIKGAVFMEIINGRPRYLKTMKP